MNFNYEKLNHLNSFEHSKLNELVQLGKEINEDVIGELLTVHFETSEVFLEELAFEYKNLNFVAIRKIAHKFKSSSGTLGLEKLHGLCNGLEDYLKISKVDSERVRWFFEQIKSEYFFTKTQLKDFKNIIDFKKASGA